MNFEQLYTEHYKSVYYTCYKYLQNEEDAKDMAQNVFIKAFNKIHTLKDTNTFKSWVNRIAANECINELKKTNRLKLEELTATNADGESFEYLEDETQKSPEELMVEDDVRDILLDIINKLPQDQRIAVHLYYYQDMTVKEISQVFNCSEQTTRNRLGYARKNIKKEIDKLEDKGVQLRSIALLPFLYLLFQAEESYAQVAIPEYASLSFAQSGATAATKAGTNTGLESVATASGTATSTAATTLGVATSTSAKTTALFGLSMKTAIIAIISVIAIAVGVAVIVLPKDDKKDEAHKSDSQKNGETLDESFSTDTTYYAKKIANDKYMELYGANCIIYKGTEIIIKDILEEKEDIVLPSTIDRRALTYGKDNYVVLQSNNEEQYAIAILSVDGSFRYYDETSKYESRINKDGNVVYIDTDYNLKCVNPTTGEEVYSTHLYELEDSSSNVSQQNSYMFNIYFAGQGNHIYDISSGELIFKSVPVEGPQYSYYLNAEILGNTYLEYEYVDFRTEKIETRYAYLVKNYTCYDMKGNILASRQEPFYLDNIVDEDSSFIFITKKENDSYLTGIFKPDLTMLIDYSEEIFNNDYYAINSDRDFEHNIYDEAIVLKFNPHETLEKHKAYVISPKRCFQCNYPSKLTIGLGDEIMVLEDMDGKVYLCDLVHDNLIETALSMDNSDNWDVGYVFNYIDGESEIIYIINQATGEVTIYSKDGEMLFTINDKRNKSLISKCISVYQNKLVYNTADTIILYDLKTNEKKEVSLEETWSGTITGFINNKYIIYYNTQEIDDDTTAFSLKALDIESNETKSLYDVRLDGYTMINLFDKFEVSDYGFWAVNSSSEYELYQFQLE